MMEVKGGGGLGGRGRRYGGVVLTQFRHEIKGLRVVFAEKVPVFPRVQIKFSLQFPRDQPLDKIPVPFLSISLYFFSLKNKIKRIYETCGPLKSSFEYHSIYV